MTLPVTAIDIADLVTLWPVAMPPLKDQGEADRMNQLLGSLLDRMRRAGKQTPEMVFVTDEPPTDERAALLGDNAAAIKATWFGMAYGRYYKTNLFRKFWASLTPDEQAQLFEEIPRG